MKSQLTYQSAGVDIHAANRLVNQIKTLVKPTRRPEMLNGIGGFGALCELPKGYEQPVLVTGTDGVGTKLCVANELARHDTIGIDLVAMCVNDLIVMGAEPLMFLDYYATGSLLEPLAASVISGIAEGCCQAGCALAGGETAEMPGMYEGNDYDLAGFCVGVVEKSKIITGESVAPGDQLIALASSGPHANGFSLIRKIVECANLDWHEKISEGEDAISLGEWALNPTRIYVKSLLSLLKTELPVHAMAHITGGGFIENLPRVLPNGCQAHIEVDSWDWHAGFHYLQAQGNVDLMEMYRTFNCGVGMVLCVPKDTADATLDYLNAAGETAWLLGEVTSKPDKVADSVLFV